MNIQDILKQFKTIEPDAEFSASSKRAILAMEPKSVWTVRRTIFHVIETGVAVALTGFFIVLIIGGFSGSRLEPQYSAIDPVSLKAEAQAIDIQIQLANLNYTETASAESTTPVPGAKHADTIASIPPLASSTATDGTEASTTATASSTSISIDQALQELSQ